METKNPMNCEMPFMREIRDSFASDMNREIKSPTKNEMPKLTITDARVSPMKNQGRRLNVAKPKANDSCMEKFFSIPLA
jgi:hypothetical protein